MTESTSEYKKRIEEIKQSIENEPYMAKMREDIAEGISKTGIRQATVEEQFQSVIDETTDKDVISAPEIILARSGAQTLGERLDSEKAEVSAQLAQTPTYDMPYIPSEINQKAVYKVSDSEYHLISKKPSKNGYTLMELKKGEGALADSQNYGGAKELLRLKGVKSLIDTVALFVPTIKATSKLSGGDDFGLISTDIGQYDFKSFPQVISNTSTNKINSWFTFDVEITKEHRGFLDLAFLGTPTTSKYVDIYIDNQLVKSIDTVTDSIETLFITIPVNALGTVEVKIEAKTNVPYRIHFIGANAQKMAEYDPKIFANALIYQTDTSHYISQSRGANDYAFLEKETGKWAGSYHGGETLEEMLLTLDGIDISTSPNSSVVFGKALRIIQSTDIIGKVKSQTITEIIFDSVFNLSVGFSVTNPFLVTSFYPTMTCSNDYFTDIVYPKKGVSSPANNLIILPNVKKVMQINPENGYSITTLFNSMTGYKSNRPLSIQHVAGSYAKVYHGLIVSSEGYLESMNFATTKIFD